MKEFPVRLSRLTETRHQTRNRDNVKHDVGGETLIWGLDDMKTTCGFDRDLKDDVPCFLNVKLGVFNYFFCFFKRFLCWFNLFAMLTSTQNFTWQPGRNAGQKWALSLTMGSEIPPGKAATCRMPKKSERYIVSWWFDSISGRWL